MKILIVGGSFGGLTAAFDLKKKLPAKEHEITVISASRRFVFIPALPWVAMGEKTIERISFDLEKPLGRKGIRFLHETLERIDPDAGKIMTDKGEHAYDFLVMATGHRSANEAVEGLGPFDGPGHSLMSPPEAEEARDAWSTFLKNPGPVVVGCAPGASCIGPAYEFAFEIDHMLKKRRMRHKVPITFVTPEPFLGHFGIGGMGDARQFLEGELEKRDIRYITSAAVANIDEASVALADGQNFDSRYSLIIPPLAGIKAIVDSPGVGNPKAFIPVDKHYRHQKFPNIYAAGVTVAFPPVEETPVPVNFPKTAHMTKQMAKIASHNIVAEIKGGEKRSREPFVACLMDMGDKAAYMAADPVRPPRNVSKLSEGKHWLWIKKIHAIYSLRSIRNGSTKVHGLGWD